VDTTIRELERAVATGEPASALRRAKNRLGLGEAVYTVDLAAEVGDRYGSFAAHAAGVRAVLKKNGLEQLGFARARVKTESYSMCSSIRLNIEAEERIYANNPSSDSEIVRQAWAYREDLAARIGEVLGCRVHANQTNLQVWQRDAEKWDPGMDYGPTGAGPRIRPEDQECYLAAFLKVEERKSKKAAKAVERVA
jgi:hypothetical protein